MLNMNLYALVLLDILLLKTQSFKKSFILSLKEKGYFNGLDLLDFTIIKRKHSIIYEHFS